MVARVHVRRERRGSGDGTRLHAALESRARELGYATLYLHASSDAAATIAFWHSRGYRRFGTLDFSTHFDRPAMWRGALPMLLAHQPTVPLVCRLHGSVVE